jgi:hypothetical protein
MPFRKAPPILRQNRGISRLQHKNSALDRRFFRVQIAIRQIRNCRRWLVPDRRAGRPSRVS